MLLSVPLIKYSPINLSPMISHHTFTDHLFTIYCG